MAGSKRGGIGGATHRRLPKRAPSETEFDLGDIYAEVSAGDEPPGEPPSPRPKGGKGGKA